MRLFLTVFSLLCLISCSSKMKEVQPTKWSYKPDSISMHISSSNELNLSGKKPHTIRMIVLQLESVEKIRENLLTAEGIGALLQNDYRKSQEVHSSAFFIEPGQVKKMRFARFAKAKDVVVIAGYYHLLPDQVVRVFNIPYKIDRNLLMIKEGTSPKDMLIKIKLGREGIIKAGYTPQ